MQKKAAPHAAFFFGRLCSMDEIPQSRPLLREEQRFRNAWTGMLLFGGAALLISIPLRALNRLMQSSPEVREELQ